LIALLALLAILPRPAPPRVGAAENSGLFVSLDEGATWSYLESSPPISSVYAIWIDPRQAGRILLATDLSLWLSEDDGQSWQPVGGEGGQDSGPIAYALASDPAAPERLWAGTESGVQQSSDGGLTWQPIGDLAAPAVGPQGTELYAGTADGLLRSRDDGNSFEPSGAGLEGAVLSIARGPDGGMLVGTTVGVFARPPAGGDFQAARGMPRGPARLVEELAGGTAYAAVSATLYRRESGWAKLATLPLASTGDPPVIGSLLPVGQDRLLVGTDHGLHGSVGWSLVPPFDGLSYLETGPIVRDPHRPERIFLGASSEPHLVGLARAGVQFEAEATAPTDDRLAALILLLFVVGGFLAARYLARRGQAPP
jgi:ligand-binding sensor domain-containing protein